MEKRIIKIMIHEKQQEIASTELIERPIFLEESCNYVLWDFVVPVTYDDERTIEVD